MISKLKMWLLPWYSLIRYRMYNSSSGFPHYYMGKKWYSIKCEQTGIDFMVTVDGEVRSGDLRKSYPIKVREFVIHPFSVKTKP